MTTEAQSLLAQRLEGINKIECMVPDSNGGLRLKHRHVAKAVSGLVFIDGYIASKTLELTRFLDEITPWERRVLAAQL